MSNNETGFIKFLTLLLVLGLMSGFSGCEDSSKLYFNQGQNHDKPGEIMGGKAVQASSTFAKKVIYLALGVTWTKTHFGMSVETEGICSAAAISKRILLTAAHCAAKWTPDQVSAVLSLNPFFQGNIESNDWISVEKIAVHEGYKKSPTIENDFALIKLSRDLPEDRISHLATAEQTAESMELVSVGYGRIDALKVDGTQDSKASLLNYILKQVEKFDSKSDRFMVEQFDESGICSGDSGSPGFIYNSAKKEFVILGVASYVTHPKNTMGQQETAVLCHGYGVYMNVLPAREWITKTAIGLN